MSVRSNAYGNRHTTLPNHVEGVVVNVSDPQQDDRVQVWCPGLDGQYAKFDNLPWAKVVTPFGGQINNYPGGSRGTPSGGLMSFGWRAIPPVNSIVMVTFLNNDPNQRRVVGSVMGNQGNRSFPIGRNRPDIGAKAPLTDNLSPVQPQTDNLMAQFNGNLDAPEARTRGAYERQAGQDKDNRDGTEGYQKSPYKGENQLTPQTFGFTTPGRHAFILQDNPENSHIRFKTTDGHQIIFDDTNERIYVSTSVGNTWIEMDKDGHVSVYGAASMSVGAGVDINLTAGRNINLSAGTGNVNIAAGGAISASSCGPLNLSGKGVFLESGADLNILSAGTMLQTGSTIHLNGPSAASAACASIPEIIPNHEPWTRPPSAISRGPNWKK